MHTPLDGTAPSQTETAYGPSQIDNQLNLITVGGHLAAPALGAEVALLQDGQRKTEPENGTRTLSSGGTYTTPDLELIAEIEEESGGKISYFPLEEVPAELRPSFRGGGEPEYSKAAMEPLLRTLAQEFPDKTLALRGVMTSINGPIAGMEGAEPDILDATQVTKEGIEKPGSIFNVAVCDGSTVSVHRVNQFAYQTGFARQFGIDGTKEQIAGVFPAILVFDASQLERPPRGGVWAAQVRDGVDPASALLKMYILDCPDV